LRAANKSNAGVKKSRPRGRGGRGIPIPDTNAELQANIDVCNLFMQIVFVLVNSDTCNVVG